MSGRRSRAEALLIDLDGVVRVPSGVDAEVLSFVREVRAVGRRVVLVADDTADVPRLGLADEFDGVLDASASGAGKPRREFFAAACDAASTPAAQCLFVDDEDRNVRGARAAGLSAYRWNGPADLPYLRAALR